MALEPIRVLHENVIMDPGGIETLIMNIYRHIDRDVVQFDFMVHRPEQAFYEDEIQALGGRIYRTPRFNPLPGAYQSYKNGMEDILIRHPEYRILHAHAELNLWPLMVAKKLGIPTRIAHSHNARTKVNLKYFFLLYEQAKIKKYCTDMFMCSTPAGQWSFGEEAVAAGQVKFIKNGIEAERFAYSEAVRIRKRQELGLRDKFVVGHVGRFMDQKNHAFLVDVFSQIYKRNPNSVLMLVGDGRLMAQVKSKVHARGIDDAVLFLGNRSDVNELMQAMDVFVLPSLWEGLPLTGIEAQTAGLPVILADTITKEVQVTDNISWMSLDNTAQEWANRILSAYCSLKRKDGRQQVANAGFDIRTTAQWLQEFYIKKSLMGKV